MFEKTLTDIVKGIRASKRDTALYISQCIAEIKTEINSSDMYVKANALQKLTFLQMMGYGMSWASFATIEVMSSPRFAQKRIGYLAASQGFTQDTEVILLTTNLLKKELRGAIGGSMNGVYEAGLAINCISNIVTEELAQDLLPELTNLTQHPQPYLRKKAILCLFKVFVKYPQGLRLTFAQIQQCLGDPNQAVVSCAVNVITELSDKNPKNYLHLAPAFFDLLTTSSNNWMLIKVVKLLGSLVPEEPRLARKLLEPLADIVKNTPAKSLLYEAVHAITLCLPYCRKSDGSMPASVPDIVALCAQTLKEFVEEKDQNLKYLGLVGFGSLMQSHPKVLSAPNYRPLILACLSDEDVTIRTRALGLLPGMASRKNLVELVTQLLQHVELASGDYKLELVRVIVEMCSGEKYALLPDFPWYLDTLFKLGHMRGLDTHSELLRTQVTEVALRVLPIRVYAVKRSIEILLEGEQINATPDIDGDNGRGKHIMPDILPALAWIVGEYSDLVPQVLSMDENAVYIYDTNSEGPYHSVVQVLSAPANQNKLPTTTQSYYVQAAMKVFAAATANKQVSNVELEACNKTLLKHLPVFMQSTDAEVQERSFTAYSLLQSLGLAHGQTGDLTPGLMALDDEESADGTEDNAGKSLLEMVGNEGLDKSKEQKSNSLASGKGVAAVCRDAAAILNYVLKPSPMKPTGAKAQKKKHQSPMGVDISILQAPLDVSVFSAWLEEEKSQRASTKLSMESVIFTQQRPFATTTTNDVGNAVYANNPTTYTGIGSDSTGLLSTFQATASSQTTLKSGANTGLDRRQNASDPFYLNSGPQMLEMDQESSLPNRFGTIQLGDADGDSGDDADADRKKRKKKKKDRKQQAQEVDVMAVFGANSPVQQARNSVTVYTSDDDDDGHVNQAKGKARSKKGGMSREFQGLASVDLTMPLREDEVMPERKHRVVPERQVEVPAASNDMTSAHHESKKKKKKKASKKDKKDTNSGPNEVGDLLNLAGFTENAGTGGTAHGNSASQGLNTFTSTMDTNQGNAISTAFDDLLDLAYPGPVASLSGGNLAFPASGASVSNTILTSSGPTPSLTSQPVQSPKASSKRPWVQCTIKTSHSAGSPVVDWSKVRLFIKVYKTSTEGNPAASIVARVDNFMEMSGLVGLTLQVKEYGVVSIGDVPPGSSRESTKFGPFAYASADAPMELKGTLNMANCSVAVKIILPVVVHLSAVEGLSLEDVAMQLNSNQWSSHSAKLPMSGGFDHVKGVLSSFLRMAEVEPGIGDGANTTLAGQSVSGAQIRILLKAKKDKVKLDLKTTNVDLGEAILADVKRLVL